jgi:hypothetical protein
MMAIKISEYTAKIEFNTTIFLIFEYKIRATAKNGDNFSR